jgi:hypothetical protein
VLRSRPLAALALALAAAAGPSSCATPCEDLGRRVCSCQPEGNARDACDRAARSAVTGEDRADAATQQLCDRKLQTCEQVPAGVGFCEWLRTCEGKVACGLAEDQACAP